jgi:hypothetical protein
MPMHKNRIEGGAEIRYDFEIKRLWKLLTEADQIIASIVYADHDDISVEPFDEPKALRWLERSAVLSPALKSIVYPPEKCAHARTDFARLEGDDGKNRTHRICLDCGEVLD